MKLHLFALFVVGSLCFGADKTPPSTGDTGLIAEGKVLESAGKLAEARRKYEQAEATANKKDSQKASKEVARITKVIAEKTKALIEEASTKNQAKDYADAAKSLNAAAEISPHSLAAACNLPVAYQGMGDIKKAIDALDRCIEMTTKKEDRIRREELRTQLLTGEKTSALNDSQKDLVKSVNEEFSENSRRVNPDSRGKKGDAVCQRLLEQKDALPKSPSILFNLARCSENEGNVDDAARYMELYLASSPETGKDEGTAAELADLKEVLAQQGAAADLAKTSYGRALQSVNTGRLDRALQEYQNVTKASPGMARAQWRLALFYENMGALDNAKAAFTAYMGVAGASEKKQAQEHLDALNERFDRYNKLMAEIRADLQKFQQERRRALDNPKLSYAEAKRVEIEHNEELLKKLQEAVDLFPLVGEPNRLLGYLYLQQDRAAAARTSFDALSLHGSAPFFYATVAEKGRKTSYTAVVQVEADGVRILPYSEWNRKSKKYTDLACRAKVEASMGLTNVTDCGEFVKGAIITTLEVRNLSIVVKSPQKEYTLTPQNPLASASLVAGSGPTWRKYSNRYARLFTRYIGIDGVKLGKEGFTGMEKFGKVMEVASIASGGFSNVGSLASNLIMTGAMATLTTFRVIQESRMELRNMLQVDNWRAIPLNPEPLAFRLDLR